MTIPVPTAPAVKAALFTALKARSELASPVGVIYGQPGTNLSDDMVILMDATGQFTPTQMVGSGGAGWLYETYTIEVQCIAYHGGDNMQTTHDRAALLMGVVMDTVRADPQIGGLVIDAFPSQFAVTTDWSENSEGVEVNATVLINVQAQL